MSRGFSAGIGLLLLFAGGARAESCTVMSPADKTRLAQYIVRKYHVPEEANLRVETEEIVGGQCYRKLGFRGDGALGAYRLTLYVTPDLRFLSTDFFDSLVDPEVEEREAAARTMGKLLEGEYASRGPANAPVTLVVFSDFQCPYCKRMQALLASEPLLQPGGSVRLVFRHMPMSQHDWAEKAAEAAACAQFQSSQAFWAFHDGLFAGQATITKANLREKVDDLAAHVPGLDMVQFRSCLERQMSLGVVIRDRDLGVRLGVQGTPTLFINGEQTPAIRDAPALHRVLERGLVARGAESERASVSSK